MRTIILTISVITIPFVLLHCGFIHKLYQEPLGLGYVVIFSEFRMLGFEKSIACYYKTHNKYPEDESVLNEFTNALKFSETDTLVFSSLKREQATNSILKYKFQLQPWNGSFKPDSSDSFIDSMRVYQFEGNLIFSDSLIVQHIDSLIVKLEMVTVCATVFIEGDSIHYNNTRYPDALIDQMKLTVDKISLSNSCLKSTK